MLMSLTQGAETSCVCVCTKRVCVSLKYWSAKQCNWLSHAKPFLLFLFPVLTINSSLTLSDLLWGGVLSKLSLIKFDIDIHVRNFKNRSFKLVVSQENKAGVKRKKNYFDDQIKVSRVLSGNEHNPL